MDQRHSQRATFVGRSTGTLVAQELVTGRPTSILFHSDYPADIHRVVAEPGKASSSTPGELAASSTARTFA